MITDPMAGLTRLRLKGVLGYMGWVYENKGSAWDVAVRRRDLTNRLLKVEP